MRSAEYEMQIHCPLKQLNVNDENRLGALNEDQFPAMLIVFFVVLAEAWITSWSIMHFLFL